MDAARGIELGMEVRCLQQKIKLSNQQSEFVAAMIADHVECKPDLKGADRELSKESGVTKVELHGCVDCNAHVFGPTDRRQTCPNCNHPRYQHATHTANEKVFYFPLKPRLEALIKLPNFMSLLQVILLRSCTHQHIISNTNIMLFTVRAKEEKELKFAVGRV